MIHVKTVLYSFLLACFLLYLSMMFTFHSETVDKPKRDISSLKTSNKKQSLKILTATPKKKSVITIPPIRSNFIMLEARQISDHFGLVLWTLINSAYLDLTLNWLCQTSQMPEIHQRVFIITTDEDTATKIRSQWPDISVLSIKSTSFNSSLVWGQQQYIDFLVLRAIIIRLFVENDVRFVLFETDSVWLRNPYEYFENYSRSADVILPKKYRPDSRGRDLTFDPMIVVPNRRSKTFFAEMYWRLTNPKLHINGTLYDQDVLDDLCRTRFADVRCRTFPWAEIADGYWFKLKDKLKLTLPTYVVNNNFYSGVENKITRQALNDFWYLTIDRRCNNESLEKLKEWNLKRDRVDGQESGL